MAAPLTVADRSRKLQYLQLLKYGGLLVCYLAFMRAVNHVWYSVGRHIACGWRAGVLLGREELQRAAELTRRAGAWLVLDNTYGAVRRPRRRPGRGPRGVSCREGLEV